MKKLKKSRVILIAAIIILIAALAVIIFGVFRNNDKFQTENIGKIYYHETSEHIAVSSNGIMYADNELLITAKDGFKPKFIEKLAKKYNSEIVGCIEATGDYQLLLENVHTYEELEEIEASLKKEECIDFAAVNYVNYASEMNSEINYGREWNGETWDDSEVAGSNWGLEAINAIGAWQYADQMTPIRVGLIDSGFDAPNSVEQIHGIASSGTEKGHEDLGFAMTFYNDAPSDHGINGFSESTIRKVDYLDSKYASYNSAIDSKKHKEVYDRIIVAGAIGNHDIYTDEEGKKHFTTLSVSSFSNLGERCDVLAPGENIFSTLPGSKYGGYSGDTWQGTSMAAPHVSGIAAMVWAVDNTLTGADVKRIPDNWSEGESDAARYKALGNSIALPCVNYIMSGIADVLYSE